jgi:two-component system, NtrC family, nitrogen regulation sensor histidine kinase GlnL
MVGFAAHMKFVEDYDPSLPPTWADGDQLLQVFLNLLKNAAEAAGKGGGTIRLRTFYDLSLRLRRKDGTQASAAPAGRDHRRRPRHAARDRAGHLRALRLGRENGTGLGPGAGVQDRLRPRRLDFGGQRAGTHGLPHLAGAARSPREKDPGGH